MPTYQYRCPSCGSEFEKFHKMTVKARPKCPNCGARAVRMISGGAGLVFKGSGFYITDYKRAGEKKETGEQSDTKAETKKPDSTEKAKPSKPAKPPKSSGAES